MQPLHAAFLGELPSWQQTHARLAHGSGHTFREAVAGEEASEDESSTTSAHLAACDSLEGCWDLHA